MNQASQGSDYFSVALACVRSEHGISPSANVQLASKANCASEYTSLECFDEFSPDTHKYL